MSNQLFPNNQWKPPSVTLISIQAVLITIATICVSLRLYARFTLGRLLSIEDGCILLGLLLAIARAVVACLSSQSGWASRAGPQAVYQIPYYTHYFERRLFYALSVFFIRAGVLIYYLRIFPSVLRRLRAASWALLALSFLQSLQLVVVLAVLCNDIADLYRGNISNYNNPNCSNASPFTYSGAIGDAAIDAMIYVLPIPYVWGLRRLRLDQRLGLVFVFGIGIIACIFALLQVPFIIMNYRHLPNGQSWFGSQVSLFIAGELSLGLVASSLPDIRGLIARKVPGFMAAFRHTDDSSGRQSGGRSGRSGPHHADQGDAENGLVGVVSIGGGNVRDHMAAARNKRTRRPDWLRSDLSSLFKDSYIGSMALGTRRNDSTDSGLPNASTPPIEPVPEIETAPPVTRVETKDAAILEKQLESSPSPPG